MNNLLRISSLYLIVLFNTMLYSQNNIVIKYTYIQSLNQPKANMTVFNAGLYIKKNKSLFVTKIDSLEGGGKRIAKTIKTKDGGIMSVSSSSNKNGFFVITDKNKDTLYANTEFNNNYNYSENVPKINWRIRKKKKKIDGIKVQKATANFRGREYTAWYATEIPVSAGPWKLQGLPGLIIEAYDKNKEVLFLFKKIQMPYKKDINFPSLDRKWNSFDGYIKKQENHIEENLKYARSISFGIDTESPENEEQKLRNGMFIELFKKN